jgi:hypothetical protein
VNQVTAPVLLVTEGEWDAMLAWQYGNDLMDFATLGGAGKRIGPRDLATLMRYAALGVVMDDDEAGDRARVYWDGMAAMRTRLVAAEPPDHDLTDFWKHGGDLRRWLARQAVRLYERALEGMEAAPEGWLRRLEWASDEASASEEAESPLPPLDKGGEESPLNPPFVRGVKNPSSILPW